MYLCLVQLDSQLDVTDWVEKVTAVNTDMALNAKAVPVLLKKGNYLLSLAQVLKRLNAPSVCVS